MKPPRLLKTSAVRLAAQYTLLYALVLGVTLGALVWSGNRHVDTQLREDMTREMSELARADAGDNGVELASTVAERARDAAGSGRFYLLIDADGVKSAGNLDRWPEDATPDFDGEVHNVWLDEGTLPANLFEDDAYLPAIAARFADGSRLLMARAVEQDTLLHEVSEYLLESLAAVVLFVLLMGVTMGRAMMRRMDSIGRTASDIMAGDLSRRVPLSGRNDEFDTLAGRLNLMLDRIESVLAGMREVTDNVAHDLRTPLTRIRNRMEVTLLERRDEREYREVMEQTISDADAIIATFNTILTTAQANAGTVRAELSPLDLSQLVAEMGELYAPLAEDAGLRLELHTDAPLLVAGNRDLLAQAIGNLIDNAVKYTPRGGHIDLSLVRRSAGAELVVADTGPGIPEQERRRVIERFVRLDTDAQTQGNGLGLSLVDAIARQHGATLRFEDNEPGLRAIMRFPAGGRGETYPIRKAPRGR